MSANACTATRTVAGRPFVCIEDHDHPEAEAERHVFVKEAGDG